MEKSLSRWERSLHAAGSYLASRGITEETALRFRLGVVHSPEPGWEMFTGRLAIPYLDRLGVYGFNFRCLVDHDCKEVDCRKYLQPVGQELGLFNILAIADSSSDTAHVVEGELDTMTLTQCVDDPVCGLPGATKWMPHWLYHLQAYERVFTWGDGDAAGKKMQERFASELKNTENVSIPPKEDINSLYCTKGPDMIRALIEDGEEDA